MAGRFLTTSAFGERVQAYVPEPLPPTPALDLSPFYSLLDQANQALGRLDGLQATLPDTRMLLYFYSRREAVLSSQIEGTQSSLSELLLFESHLAGPSEDVTEVSNYVAALEHGLKRLRELPLCNRLFQEMHAILLRKGRGSDRQPGEFRRSQNWIGGSRPGNAMYVPPPVPEMEIVMSDLERFLHREDQHLPLLIDAALVHAQFESAHPFLDGNGRLGRMLVVLLLVERGVLKEPSLYLSLYLKQHRDLYYELLQETRTKSAWTPWVTFFLKAIKSAADEACSTAQRIQALFSSDRERLKVLSRPGSVLQLHEYLQRHPITDLQYAAQNTGLSISTIGLAMDRIAELDIVNEQTGRRRGRVFVYTAFLKILDEGTERPSASRSSQPASPSNTV
jgi:cell filamentation protein, protein adenylyltransferase